MTYCINPRCQKRQNPDNLEYCQACGSRLIINNRYRLIRPLRELDEHYTTEIFEIDDSGKLKVLKILNSDRRRFIELFQQEVQVLQRLRYPGIPLVDDYFVFSPNNSTKQLHCLVMEKIEGQNLKQWVEEHRAISEAVAIDWLKQLLQILAQVHQEQLLHRDIKPSNIMLRPNGQLVLIDFGTVREVTGTYIQKLEDRDITRVYSPGYTAPEQLEGKAVWQSDFFALGRTFVYLLTGMYPDDLPKNPQTNQLSWQEYAPQISAVLADLIDQLMELLPQNRPSNAQVILNQLAGESISDVTRLPASEDSTLAIDNLEFASTLDLPVDKIRAQRQTKLQQEIKPQQFFVSTRRKLLTGLLFMSVATTAVLGVRQLGILQTLELQAFDQMMRLRPVEKPDQRLLVVGVSETDIQSQKQRQGSLSDAALDQLLKKLEQYQPQAIGLDIYRDFPVSSQYADLATRLKKSDRLIAVCKVSDPVANISAVPPPPEIPTQRVGFSDVIADEDSNNIVRRQLIHLTPPLTSSCATKYAFNFQLALHYLAALGIQATVTPQGELQIGKTVFKPLKNPTGGYQTIDSKGYQVLLNYRPYRSLEDIAPQVTLGDILSDRISPSLVKELQGRIILIGVTAPSVSDYWFTPYSSVQPPNQKQIPGIFLQAQMVSQILSAVLDGRPLLWVWSRWIEALWILGWSLIGAILAWWWRSLLNLGLTLIVVSIILSGLCFALLTMGGWIPFVPSLLALITTSGSIVVYKKSIYYNSNRY